MKKTLFLASTLFMLLFIVIGVFCFATAEAPVLELKGASLLMEDSVQIRYVVSAENLADINDVKLLVFSEAPDSYVKGSENYEVSYGGDTVIAPDGTLCYCFDFEGTKAKTMTDDYYAVAYVKNASGEFYSLPAKYSVLKYAYTKMGRLDDAVSTDSQLITMLSEMLEYGASAQKYFNYKTDRLATAEFYQVRVDGGTLADGFDSGLYITGESVKISAPEQSSDGAGFAYWADSLGNKISSDAVYTVTVGTQNAVYTPVYVKYSEGLEYESNGDGTCCIVDIGSFSGEELVIPAVSPDGDAVTEIDSSVFAGESLISVSFPSTITDIGRKAFNGCDTLTDVYYDGSAEQWAEVNIGTYNDPILNATMHYSVVTTYMVTFVSYDSSVLKTEAVVKGGSATAPAAPERAGYTFTGWDVDFSDVTSDLTVTAQYEAASSDPTIVISSADAAAGQTGVEITVALRSNPGISSLNLLVEYDDTIMTLTEIVYNDSIGGMSQLPQTYDSPVILNWFNGAANSTGDWVFATLKFDISAEAAEGDYTITLSYDPENIYDISETNITFEISDGKITVK